VDDPLLGALAGADKNPAVALVHVLEQDANQLAGPKPGVEQSQDDRLVAESRGPLVVALALAGADVVPGVIARSQHSLDVLLGEGLNRLLFRSWPVNLADDMNLFDRDGGLC
jgi:hypothetical protein